MDQPDERDLRIRELEERLSLLSQASLGITQDLDMSTVLRGVVDGARLLTGASRGCITIFDDDGEVQEFITSGINDVDLQRVVNSEETLSAGLDLAAYLGSLHEPLRVADFYAHTAPLGLPNIGSPVGPVGSFLSAPIRLRGTRVGHFFLSYKRESEEFSQEDEETLMLFAAQAAMAIANARRHREERAARADLETLIDTSPIGVVVFDAVTGIPKSFNREARRVADCLREPDQATEQLMEVLTCVRADGREISLREFPLPELLGAGETVRAEEVILRVPGGSSVTALVNATPIFSEAGTVETVVVTLHDMAEVKELERMRADFLAMVSHELRTPLTSIKGCASAIMDGGSYLDSAVVLQFARIISEQTEHMNSLVSDLLDAARIESGTLPVSPEPAEVAALVDAARSSFSGGGSRHSVVVDLDPHLPLVLADRRRIVQVLINLLSNAARNSPDSLVIRVNAVRQDFNVMVSVSDQGRGIPAESLPQLFQKFSRVQAEGQGGDTGLGLAICKGIVEAHGGRIWAESDGPGLGARFTFTLPTVEMVSDYSPVGQSAAGARSTRQEYGEVGERVPVLVVDDDPQALRYIRDTLVRANYRPVVTGDPGEALRLMEEERPRLALLDLMMPGTDGIDLMQTILGVADLPVIFISAYGRDELIARAFDEGAVDYVVKPFSPTELLARIRAALRLRASPKSSDPYVLGNLTVDYHRRQVTLSGLPVPLAALEYRMLSELSANGGRVLTYEHLLERVWGERGGGDLRPMRTIVTRLRRKLGDDADNPAYIFTQPRVGYWMPQGDRPAQAG